MTEHYRTFADRSGTSVQSIIDAKSPQAIEDALGQLFQAWKGKSEEQSPVRFSPVVNSDGKQAITILPTNEHAIISATEAQQFLSVVAGAAGDFKAKFDDSGALQITEPLQKWALGIQKMRSGLAQQQDISAAR